jgi:hypothetical protein
MFVLVLGLFMTTAVSQAAGPKDYAKGSGVSFMGDRFSFNASSDPAGGDPKGTMSIARQTATGVATADATVTCLVVIGDFGSGTARRAAIVGDIIRHSANWTFGDGLHFNVRDSGEPGGTGDYFSFFVSADSQPEGAPLCETSLVGVAPIQSGDITIIDE